jgi:hypothetical protein
MDHVATWVMLNGDGMVCENFNVVLDKWAVQEHTLVAKFHFKTTVNDGNSDYGPGEMGAVYHVTVKSAVEATPAPKKP